MPTIKSSTDLRNNYNGISKFCRERREPVFITKNGQGDLVVMSIDVYNDIMERHNKFMEELERRIADAENKNEV